ncbi:MAG TPA: hypothetical protein VFB82_01830 [Blastocatellia bacterium]|nr:hypothetical protein [Blastocatellia bacterium]
MVHPTTRDHSRGRVLVVAALGRELAALERDRDPRIALLETGEGETNAERTLCSWLEDESPRAVLGIGFAGALSDSLGPGDLIVASECRTVGSSVVSTTRELLEMARRIQISAVPLTIGVTVTVDEVVCHAEAKQRLAMGLRAGEIACVDMESSAVARVCTERRIPFLIARAITDLFSEDLPLDFNQTRGTDGMVRNWKVIRAALRKPSSIKGLRELERRSAACSENLAAFVRRLAADIS